MGCEIGKLLNVLALGKYYGSLKCLCAHNETVSLKRKSMQIICQCFDSSWNSNKIAEVAG